MVSKTEKRKTNNMRKASGGKGLTYTARRGDELKLMDTVIPSTEVLDGVLTDNTRIYPLNILTTGAGAYQRNARKVTNKSIRVQGRAHMVVDHSGTATVADAVVRLCLVWDKAPNGLAVPKFNEIFGVQKNDGTSTDATMMSPLGPQAASRFEILRDVKIHLRPQTEGTTYTTNSVTSQWFDFYVNLRDAETSYRASTSDYPAISAGGLLLVARCANSNSSITLHQTSSRLRFIE